MKGDDSNRPKTPDEMNDGSSPQQEWMELRHRLVGPEIAQFGRIEERLDNPGVRAEEISRILPEAITL
ncbi:MAG: OmpA family protein, partial [Bacteroidota bacterium]